MEKVLTFVLAIGLTKKDLEDLGFPEKVSKKDLKNLSVMMGKLLQDKDLRPLMRRAADALGLNVKGAKLTNSPGRKSKTQALLQRSNRDGGLSKSKNLHAVGVETLKDSL
jgi:hypothetical protein